MTIILVIALYFIGIFYETFCDSIQYPYVERVVRHCEQCSEGTSSHISLGLLLMMIIFTTIFCLILLGLIKGLMGLLCCPPIGMWGLGTLMDLPRPLPKYQERDLAEYCVIYDDTGWPVHPETRKRSVRAITKKTEFYLNIIFFLTYPLAMLVTMCSACFFTDAPDCEQQCYKCVNTIVFTDCKAIETQKTAKCQPNPTKKKKSKPKKKYIYNDTDSAEDEDTRYVCYQLKHSRESLQSGSCDCY